MKEATLQFHKRQMLKALVHIQQRLDQPLALRELASLAGLAPHHFHHVFTGMIGESVAAHIRRLRLERAASRLKTTRRSVIDIALEAGYQTHESFTRAFRDAFGASPTRFRQRHNMAAQLPASSGLHYAAARPPDGFRAKNSGVKTMHVHVKQFSPLRVAFMRHTGPYDQVGELWSRFMTLLGKEGWIGGQAQFIGLCHDDPAVTPSDKIRYDACMTVGASFQPFADVGAQTIAGGDYAVMTHFGPYQKLAASYAKLLGQWLPRSGRTLRPAPSFEVYFNSPEDTPPKDLVTDICVPLE